MKEFLSLLFVLTSFTLWGQKSTEAFSCYQSKKYVHGKSMKSLDDARSDSLDIIHTALHIDMSNWGSRSLDARAEIAIKALVENVNTLRLDLQGLQVDSVKRRGKLLNFAHNDTLLIIDLQTALNESQVIEIQVFYHGVPMQNAADWGGFYWTKKYAFNVGVSFLEDPPNYGRVWFPCFDNFVERSTFEFFIKTNASRKAFCNGLLIAEVANQDGTITWHWQMNQEIPSYLASVAVADYTMVELQYNGVQGASIPIQLVARAADTSNMKASFIHLMDAMQCFEEFYAPYAFDRIGYCLTSFNAGAMEHATNITYMRAAVNGTTSQETLMAHELSHHWWGDLVTCETTEDMWLNEGWASFSEALFIDYVYGEEAYKAYSRENHDNVLRLVHLNDGEYLPVSGVSSNQTYSSTVYDKGADMAHTIRGILGEVDFSNCIEAFLNDHAFEAVNSALFESYLSACSGKDLSSFFDSWIFEKGFHHYSIDYMKIKAQADSYIAEGTIKQKLWETNTYTNNLPISVTFYKNQTESVSFDINTTGACTSFSVELSFEPVYYALDVDEKIQDATVDKYEIISQTGTTDLNLARVIFNVSEIGDSVLVHATHHYIEPDRFQTNVPGLHLSPNRYWSIGGVWDEDFKTDAIFRFNGSNSSSFGYLDNDLITNSEDSLVLLYKPEPLDDWQIVDSFTLSTQGSALNKVGYFEVYNVKQGDYVLASYDNSLLTINAPFNPCVYTGITNQNQFKQLPRIYPAPHEDSFSVEIIDTQKEGVIVKVHNLAGTEVFSKQLKGNEKSVLISSKEWQKGSYIVSVQTDKQSLYSQKILVK